MDQTAGLKDRVHTALQFDALPGPSNAYHQLLLLDATGAVRDLSIPELFPWRLSARLGMALLPFVPAAGLALWSSSPRPTSSMRPPPPSSSLTALADDLESWANRGSPPHHPALQAAHQTARALANRLRRGDCNREDALLTLARIEAALDAGERKVEASSMQRALALLARGSSRLPPLAAMAEQLHAGRYDQAATTVTELARRIREGRADAMVSSTTVTARLHQLAEETAHSATTDLSAAITSLAEAIEDGADVRVATAFEGLRSVLTAAARQIGDGRMLAQRRLQLAALREKLARESGPAGADAWTSAIRPDSSTARHPADPDRNGGVTADPQGTGDAPLRRDEPRSGNRINAEVELAALPGERGQGAAETVMRTIVPTKESATAKPRDVRIAYEREPEAAVRMTTLSLAHRVTVQRYFARPLTQRSHHGRPEDRRTTDPSDRARVHPKPQETGE